MKTERLNLAIFYVSGLVFLLQMVGYLSPAWFVQEVRALHSNKGFHIDGRHFRLPIPGMEPMPENNMMSPMPEDTNMMGDKGEQMGRRKRNFAVFNLNPNPEPHTTVKDDRLRKLTNVASVSDTGNNDYFFKI